MAVRRSRLSGNGQGDLARGLDFEHAAQLVQLLHFLGGEGAHQGAHVLAALDEAHAVQRGQGLAGHMALDVEAGHEVVLHQALARVQPAEDHVLFQRGHHGAQGVGCGAGSASREIGSEAAATIKTGGWDKDAILSELTACADYSRRPGMVPRSVVQRRKSKSTPWSAWFTVVRKSLR